MIIDTECVVLFSLTGTTWEERYVELSGQLLPKIIAIQDRVRSESGRVLHEARMMFQNGTAWARCEFK